MQISIKKRMSENKHKIEKPRLKMRGGFFQEVDVVLVDLIRLVGLMGKQGKGILVSSSRFLC
jgi:hypothetical protein